MISLSPRRGAFAAVLIAAAAVLVAPQAAAAPRPLHVQGTSTVPVYSYADAIRESIWVTTSLDNDGDGVRDKVVSLPRPQHW